MIIDESTDERVWVENVTVFEHSNNYASVSRPVKENTVFKDEEGTTTYVSHEEFERTWKEWSEKGSIPVTENTQQDEPEQSNPNPQRHAGGAKVGTNKTTGNFSDPFAGTTWGNK